MASGDFVGNILKPLCDKVDRLKLVMEVLKCVKDDQPQSLKLIRQIGAKVSQMEQGVEKLQHMLKEQKKLNEEMQVLQIELSHGMYKLDRLGEIIKEKHLTENTDCNSTNGSSPHQMEPVAQFSGNYEFTPVELKCGLPTLGKALNLKPKCSLRFDIHYLNVGEFKTIPKYMLGRLSLEDINKFVDVVNEALSKKYNILSKPMSALKTQELNLHRIFKKQNSKLKGRDFVTEEDIAREFGKRVLDKKAYNFLTILRHTKKLGRETFDDGVAYVISNSE